MDEKTVFDVKYDNVLKTARRTRRRPWPMLVLIVLAFSVLSTHIYLSHSDSLRRAVRIPANSAAVQARCANLKLKAGPSPTFSTRTSSDRFAPGTKSALIRNATIWTGRINGLEIIKGDILLEQGLIKALGHVEEILLDDDTVTFDANGAWVTPGIVDLHSHIGVSSVPSLSGAGDSNSRKGIAQPWLRTLDGLNTHDEAYRLSISGGVTTALVLPGSANDIGGQGFVIKLRPTSERSPTSMLLEPPFTLNSSDSIDLSLPPRWRQMKHACGENPRRVYGNSRMDNIWAFREVYDKARQIKEKQDAFCEKALDGEWSGLGAFPEELQWEALVDVLRGRVKVQVHCYEAVDLDGIVRLTNEFKFPIAAFHHAHETYLVPDLLKKAYGYPPASAMFASRARFKRESYRGSEFAPKILAENGLPVVLKSDHPVLNSRHLLYEAQQAHYYGLPENLALASVTTTPAQAMGMDHRVGFIREGCDAGNAISLRPQNTWTSHTRQPLQTSSSGTHTRLRSGQRRSRSSSTASCSSMRRTRRTSPHASRRRPQTPDFAKEAADAVKYEGLPPLEPQKSVGGTVVFTNVKSVMLRTAASREGIVSAFEARGEVFGVFVVTNGSVACAGIQSACTSFFEAPGAEVVDLKGGAISPGLVSFGSMLGLEEIQGESSTRDGAVYDSLEESVPGILGGEGALIHAADGLQYATRHAYLAYRAGVTVGVAAPLQYGFLGGLSTAFGLGAAHKMESGALVQEVAAVHVAIGHSGSSASVSTQVAALRRLLLDGGKGDVGSYFKNVADGKMTLVVNAESADIISTLLLLKKEVEGKTGASMKLTIFGASEAHLLAKELAVADVGVIVAPSRPFPKSWDARRILPGLPLTKDSAISLLLAHNVTVGIGITEPSTARHTRFDVAWAALDASGGISKTQALALASSNLEKLLGVNVESELADLVATEGGDLFDFESKVVGVISPKNGAVDIFRY
ncbi:hypothetical protein EW145_g5277 [Phellinidium pouzarii]|uniref:Uncharacterized protein n=1 Tax=Phellinidium pouzarii TaxID=167371 RepID=A0A4S4L0K1_9AGAM|nr:hypothetical protein EW145_g5277 [Phellinidium pouzarii]